MKCICKSLAGDKWRVVSGRFDIDWGEDADFDCAMLRDGIDCDTPEDEEEAEADAGADASPSPSRAAGVHGSTQPSPEDNSTVDEDNETESITSRSALDLRPQTVKIKCEPDGSRDWQCHVRVKDEPNSAEEMEPGSPFVVANSPEPPRGPHNDKEYLSASMFEVLPCYKVGRQALSAHDFSTLAASACDSHQAKNMMDLAAFLEPDPIWIDP